MREVTVKGRLSAAVADAGTFTVSYPARPEPAGGVYNEGDFYKAMQHQLVMGQSVLAYPDDFDLTFGTANITVTNKSGASWTVDSDFILGLNQPGKAVFLSAPQNGAKQVERAAKAQVVVINLGAPDTLDADGVCVSASITAAAGGTIGGALASGGVAVFDVPRNVVVTSAGDETGTVFTITGTDEYGNVLVEDITGANAGAAAGKKAFKTVTAVDVDGDSTSTVTVGSGDVLGLPVMLPETKLVLAELQDGVAATAGTLVAGVRTAGGATATDGDVRGTYDPNAACDGDKVFQLIAALPDPDYLGIAQFTG